MMKKLLLLSLVVCGFAKLQAQELPSQKEAEQKILSNQTIIKQIEEKMGMPISKLTVENDKWKGYQGSTFSLARTKCGKLYEYIWPYDAIYTQYIIQSPKNKEGVYKSMYAKVYYKRSKSTLDNCILTNQWSFWEVSLGNPSEYGYKEFTKEEAKEIFLDYVKSGKAEVLNDYTEISKIDFERFSQSSENAGIHYLKFYYKGKRAVFTDDYSAILVQNNDDGLRFNLKVVKEGDKWVGTNMSIMSISRIYEVDLEKAFQYGDEPDQFYSSYKTHGWDAIYPKATPIEKPKGELEALEARITSFYNLLKEKGAGFTQEDISAYIAPSNKAAFEQWFTKMDQGNTRMAVESFNYKGVMPVKRLNDDGTYTKMAFPEMNGKLAKMIKKRKILFMVS